MRIEELQLHNFRRYEAALFRFHPQFTVLVGDNGKGKTTVLDALAVLFGTYFQGSGIEIGRRTIQKSDARFVVHEVEGQVSFEPQRTVYLKATVETGGRLLTWRRDLGDRGSKARELIELGAQHRDRVAAGDFTDLPLMLYYGSGRLWCPHKDVQPDRPGSRLDAYRFSLDPKSDHKGFERWFKRLTYAALQKGTESPAIEAVAHVVKSCIPDAQSFFFDTGGDHMVLSLDDGESVPFDNLSDGFRNMVAMVADIAHRASRLNPHLGADAPALTRGIVLIDEIDLHLHPRWQRRVVHDLKTAFPALQFIATTHSPFILQSLSPGEVIDLDLDTSAAIVKATLPGAAALAKKEAIKDEKRS